MRPSRRGRILLVDDDPRFASLVEQHLRGHGYEVTLADSVASAAESLDTAVAVGAVPDIVLLDINLPDDAGWALLGTAGYPAAGAPPVVVITATEISPRRLREHGVAGCLTKPFAMETLVQTIDRLTTVEEPQGAM
jgi:DNA-binding response OmpR family regulator